MDFNPDAIPADSLDPAPGSAGNFTTGPFAIIAGIEAATISGGGAIADEPELRSLRIASFPEELCFRLVSAGDFPVSVPSTRTR
jgi:hypothetical protein